MKQIICYVLFLTIINAATAANDTNVNYNKAKLSKQLFKIINDRNKIIQKAKSLSSKSLKDEMDAIISKLDKVRDDAEKLEDKLAQGAAILQIGSCYQFLEDLTNAKVWYKKITDKPDYYCSRTLSLARLSLGHLAIRQGKYEEAKENFKKIIEKYPEEDIIEEAKIWNAHSFAFNNEFKEAKSHYAELQSIYPDAQILIAAMDEEISIAERNKGETITIGALTDISGATADLGRDYSCGISEAISFINDHGGINNKMVKLYLYDFGYRIPEALNQYELLKQRNVTAILGWLDADTKALSHRITKDRIPYVSASYSPRLTNPIRAPYNLFAATDYSTNARAAITAWFDNKWPNHPDFGKRKPRFQCAYMFENRYSSEPIRAIKDQSMILGFEIGPDQNIPMFSTDTKSQVLAMKNYRPDLIWHGNTLMSVASTIRDAYNFGLNANHVVNNWAYDENLLLLLGKASEGVMGVTVCAFIGEDVRMMDNVIAYARRLNPGISLERRSIRTVQAWANVLVLSEALRRADRLGDLTGQSILKRGFETFRGFNIGLRVPPITYTSSDHRISGKVPVYEIKDGKFNLVDIVNLRERWPQKWKENWLGW